MLLVTLASTALVQAGTVSVDIQHARSGSPIGRADRLAAAAFESNLARRSTDDIPEQLANGFYNYQATLYMGSEKQFATATIDTGSSDLWLMAPSNPYCGTPDFDCDGFIFYYENSTTLKNLSIPFDISYLDTTGAFGYYVTDDVGFSDGETVQDAEFAIADTANSSESVFGIGFTTNEDSVIFNDNGTLSGYQYPNLPVKMKSQGLIDRISYSVFLNEVNSTYGQILFGGVDHAKYSGTLALLPMLQVYIYPELIDFRIMLNRISVKTGDNVCGLIETGIPLLLDTGTSYSTLPPVIIETMADAMNYTTVANGYYSGDCSEDFAFDSFELDFMGVKLEMSPRSLLDNLTDSNGDLVYKDGKKQCILATMETTEAIDYILGDSFMRDFYVVFDLEGGQVGIAQANYDGGSDVEVISTGIPRATSAPSYSSTAFTLDFTLLNSSCLASSTTLASGSASASALPFSATASGKRHGTGLSATKGFSAATGSAYANKTLAQSTQAHAATATVDYTVVDVFTTSCSEPTVFSTNGQTYTVTEPTVITITDCPCTLSASPSVVAETVAPSIEAASSSLAPVLANSASRWTAPLAATLLALASACFIFV